MKFISLGSRIDIVTFAYLGETRVRSDRLTRVDILLPINNVLTIPIMKVKVVLLFILGLTNVAIAQRGDTEPPDDTEAGGGTGGGGGIGRFQELLGQIGVQDEDGDGIPDVLEGLDGIPTNITEIDPNDLAGVNLPNAGLTGELRLLPSDHFIYK